MVDMLLFQKPCVLTQVLPSLFQELIRRRGLGRALAGRDEDGLEPILDFLIRQVVIVIA